MLLYDLFYPNSRDCDFNMPLPPTAPKGTVARCTNWGGEVLTFGGSEWTDAQNDEEA